MKSILALAIALFLNASDHSLLAENNGLPTLHKIQTTILSPSYSCRPVSEFTTGYSATALFLSSYSRQRNSPDLLFNGACGSQDYFQGSVAGDDMSLIADLGEIPIADVSSSRAFNPAHVSGQDSRFLAHVVPALHHTFALVINKADCRGLVIFTVDEYVPNKKVSLRYAVQEYQVMAKRMEAPGFAWESKNE